MSSRIAVISIDAVQPRKVADFWCAVLGWRVEEDSWVVLRDPDGNEFCLLSRSVQEAYSVEPTMS